MISHQNFHFLYTSALYCNFTTRGEGEITDQLTVLQGRESPVGTGEESELVRKQYFKFRRKDKSLSLQGNEPRHQFSAFHCSRLHFASRLSDAVLFL